MEKIFVSHINIYFQFVEIKFPKFRIAGLIGTKRMNKNEEWSEFPGRATDNQPSQCRLLDKLILSKMPFLFSICLARKSSEINYRKNAFSSQVADRAGALLRSVSVARL